MYEIMELVSSPTSTELGIPLYCLLPFLVTAAYVSHHLATSSHRLLLLTRTTSAKTCDRVSTLL